MKKKEEKKAITKRFLNLLELWSFYKLHIQFVYVFVSRVMKAKGF